MQKINLKKGSGEIIGFAIVIPFVVFLFLFIVNVFQISLCEEKLIYSAYCVGRKAAISYSKEEAKKNAEEVLAEIYADNYDKVGCEIEVKGSWVKGNILFVHVTYNLRGAAGIQTGIHERAIAMMVEHSYWGEVWN